MGPAHDQTNGTTMKKPFFLLSLALGLLFPCPNAAQEITSAGIDSLVQRVLEITPSVGLAVAVVKDGRTIHSKGYGIRSVQGREKVDRSTLFSIASNSKAFTAASLAILVDRGKLSWEDRVIDHIPEFRMYNDYVTNNFNIVDLLTHRSGLGLGAGDLMFFPDGADYTIHDVVTSFQYQRPVSAFRTKYDYDNLLYVVAGEVVARVSGKPWADFIQTEILDPLGMEQSVPTSSRLPENANLALPHDSGGDKIVQHTTYHMDLTGAAGGIMASVEDLSHWMLLQLNGGKYGPELSKTLFSEKQQRQMWRPHTNINFNVRPDPANKQHFMAYGLGWRLADRMGKIVISHTGGLPGMLSKTILVPELNLGIVVLTNSAPGGYAYSSVPEMILDSYLGIEKRDWIKISADRAKATGQESDSVTDQVWAIVAGNSDKTPDLTPYLGTYEDPWFGQVKIALKEGKLWFTSKRSPKLNGPMYHYRATTFAVKWEYTNMSADAFATFDLDEQGKGIGIRMKGISPNIDFSFDFHDLDLQRIEP